MYVHFFNNDSVVTNEINNHNADVVRNDTHDHEKEMASDVDVVVNGTSGTIDHMTNLAPYVHVVTIVSVITFSSIAKLASTGNTIILQKDWIVVIADNDLDLLASGFDKISI